MAIHEILILIISLGGLILIPTGMQIVRDSNVIVGSIMVFYGLCCGFVAMAGIIGF